MSESARPSRAPWIIAGVVGCLVLCFGLAVLVVGGYFVFGQTTSRPLPVLTPFTFAVTEVPSPTPIALATLLPTATSASPIALASVTPTSTIAAAPIATPRPVASPTSAQPRGKIAFSVSRGDTPPDKLVYVMNLDGTGAHQVLDRASSPAWSPDGSRIFYYHWEDGIFVANADGTNQKKLIGESNAKFLELSHDGRWIAWTVQPSQSAPKNIDAVLTDGTGRRPIVNGGSLPSWSPGDDQVVYHSCRETMCGLFKVNSAGGDGVLFTSDVGASPAWSPNGQRIVYTIEVNGIKQLFLINANGTSKKQLTHTNAHHVGAQWSPDGNFIFYRSPEGGSWAIWRMTADGANPVKLIDNVPPTDEAFEKLAVVK